MSMAGHNDKQEAEALRTKLILETALMPWKELQRHFASGTMLAIDEKLDLIEVAMAIANDDKPAVVQWMSDNQLAKVSDAQALAWLEADIDLWAVVVKPWILVQQKKTH